jgi:hypothetical protein
MIFFGVGILLGIYLSFLHFTGHSIGDRPLLLLSLLLMIVGVQILFTGLIADLILNVSNHDGKIVNTPLKYSSEA